jgi:hypothetical protein
MSLIVHFSKLINRISLQVPRPDLDLEESIPSQLTQQTPKAKTYHIIYPAYSIDTINNFLLIDDCLITTG